MALALIRLLDPAADDDLQISGRIIRRMTDASKLKQGDGERPELGQQAAKRPLVGHSCRFGLFLKADAVSSRHLQGEAVVRIPLGPPYAVSGIPAKVSLARSSAAKQPIRKRPQTGHSSTPQ